MKIGNRIRDLRKKSGLTMKELAKRTGISYATIHRIEKGAQSPSVAVLSDIAHELGQPIISFFKNPFQKITIFKAKEQPSVKSGGHSLRLVVPRGIISSHISVSFGTLEEKSTISPHSNSGHELAFIINGHCIFKYDNTEHPLKKGDAVFFSGAPVHSVQAIEKTQFLAFYFREEE